MNQKEKQKKPSQKKSITKPKPDWRKQIVSDIERVIKASGMKNPQTEKFAIGYPARLVEGKKWEEVIDDKILWKMMKGKWTGLWSLSSSQSGGFEVFKGGGGKTVVEQFPIGISRLNKRSCKTAVSLMKEDMKSCAEADKKLEVAGIKKPKKDIFKDDCCYGCKFAIENRDSNMGPFDRRFVCDGFSRFTHQIGVAAGFLAEGYSAKDETTKIRFLMKVQKELLYLAMIIGERVEKGKLECIETNGKPSCFVGAKLDEWLTIK